MHPSNSIAVPVISFIVLLCNLPLPTAASSTRSPRSCHLAVAGDRGALPASMLSGPAALAGSVDSAGTPQQPTPREVKPPHRVGKAAALRRSTDQHEFNWLGSAVPIASSTPSTSSDAKVERRYSPKRRPPSCRPKATLPVSLVARGSGQDHQASDYSYRGTSPPRPLSSPQGNVSCNSCNWRRDDRPRDLESQNSLSLKGAFSNIKEARGAVQYENVFLGWHACAARTSPSRWRAPLARSAPADSSSRRHCRGTGTRCLGPRCPHCAPRLPGPQAPDRGDGPLHAPVLNLKSRTRALRVPRSPVPTALAGLSWCR